MRSSLQAKTLEGLFANPLMYSLKCGEMKEVLMHLIDITESITEYEKIIHEFLGEQKGERETPAATNIV